MLCNTMLKQKCPSLYLEWINVLCVHSGTLILTLGPFASEQRVYIYNLQMIYS